MKKATCILIFGLLCCIDLLAQEFKVIGYLPYYRFQLIDEIQFDKITHLNIAFANPDQDGNLSIGGRDMTDVVNAAHDANVDVFISLAGGALTTEWAMAWEELIMPQNRSAFINKIIAYTLAHELQGIDLDLEWSHVDDNYSGFVLELKDSLDLYNLDLTAALPGLYRYPQITNSALQAYDWINMMVYDLRGPWDPGNAGPHSPISFAYDAIDYWTSHGMDGDKLTLGIPFYGYDFSDPSHTQALTYNQIVNLDTDNAFLDQSGDIYYNGIPTVEEKTSIALAELGGVMMWELGQDRFDDYSLLSAIDEVVESTMSGFTNLFHKSVRIYPNPFESKLFVEIEHEINGVFQLFDIQGRLLFTEEITLGHELEFDFNYLNKGMYVLTITSNHQHYATTIIKK